VSLYGQRPRPKRGCRSVLCVKPAIPAANIPHLITVASEQVSQEEYKDQIENPCKFLDANGGVARRKILHIVPTYGVLGRSASSSPWIGAGYDVCGQ
jgi:hypothetical protein